MVLGMLTPSPTALALGRNIRSLWILILFRNYWYKTDEEKLTPTMLVIKAFDV
jgi:hypothetical protein